MATNDVRKWLLDLLDDIKGVIEIASYASPPSVPVVTKPKTNVELAEEILVKHDYCLVHLVKKVRSEKNHVYFNPYYHCPLCDKEEADRRKLEQDKQDAVRDVDIDFALDVMRERTVCKSK